MTKTPTQIEKGIQCCLRALGFDDLCGPDCPYWDLPASECAGAIGKDVQEYIDQLKDENAKLKSEIEDLKNRNAIFMAENAVLHAERGTGISKDIPTAIPVISDACSSDEELRGEMFYADYPDEGE